MHKTKILIISSIILFLFITFFTVKNKSQTIDIIYFTNPRCVISNQTDELIGEIKNDFKDRINITTIIVSMFEGDSPDTEEIKQLREQYKIYGAPVIIINGKEFTKAYTIDNLREEICEEFLIKPLVCFK